MLHRSTLRANPEEKEEPNGQERLFAAGERCCTAPLSGNPEARGASLLGRWIAAGPNAAQATARLCHQGRRMRPPNGGRFKGIVSAPGHHPSLLVAEVTLPKPDRGAVPGVCPRHVDAH